MSNRWFKLMFVLLGWPVIVAATESPPVQIDFGLDTAYREDSLNWNIASEITGTATPNIASELRWNKLKILQTKLHFNLEYSRVVLYSSVAAGTIIDGNNEDVDYAGNNRAQEWSRSHNDAGAGDTGDLSAGLGYHFIIPSAQLSIVPLAGYAYHRQNLHMRNGVQTVSRAATIDGTVVVAQPLGPITGLDSTYDASWNGPWLGLDINWQYSRWQVKLLSRYEWLNYRGEANWNLRSDLQHPLSFVQLASGSGWRLGSKVDYAVTDAWRVGLSACISRYSTHNGTDTQIDINGATGVTRLNEVRWDSAAIGLTVAYRY